jgi:hypothetical protein
MSLNGKYNAIFPIYIKSCAPQLLWQHLSKNDSCHTSLLNSGNSGTFLTVLCSPNPIKKNARAQWSEFSVVKSDDDDDDDDFLYHQSPVYHHNPADESDDSLSDISYQDNDKHDSLSSDLLYQEDEQIDSTSERQGDSVSEREGGSDEETDSASERDIGFDKETDSASESQMDQGLAPVGLLTPIQALPFLQMMKQHSALPHSFPRTRPILSNLSL